MSVLVEVVAVGCARSRVCTVAAPNLVVVPLLTSTKRNTAQHKAQSKIIRIRKL